MKNIETLDEVRAHLAPYIDDMKALEAEENAAIDDGNLPAATDANSRLLAASAAFRAEVDRLRSGGVKFHLRHTEYKMNYSVIA